MKIEANSPEFYEKYQFTSTMTQKHPVYGDTMEFKGLEADYVSRLEREVEHYKACLAETIRSNDRYQRVEHYRLEDEIKKLTIEKEKLTK